MSWYEVHLCYCRFCSSVNMMTSSNGNIFRLTGQLCGPDEFHAQMPVTWSFDVFFDLHLNKRLSKQSWGWWFETPSRPLWRQSNVLPVFTGDVTLLRVWKSWYSTRFGVIICGQGKYNPVGFMYASKQTYIDMFKQIWKARRLNSQFFRNIIDRWLSARLQYLHC